MKSSGLSSISGFTDSKHMHGDVPPFRGDYQGRAILADAASLPYNANKLNWHMR